jgi:hypothetical protein
MTLELAHVTTRSLTQVETLKRRWAVITRCAVRGYPPFRSDDFETRDEAIRYLHSVAQTTPRVSLRGNSPNPAPSLASQVVARLLRARPASRVASERGTIKRAPTTSGVKADGVARRAWPWRWRKAAVRDGMRATHLQNLGG